MLMLMSLRCLQHPITRFHSRYIQESPEQIYERHLHFLNIEMENIMLKYELLSFAEL